MAFQIVLSESDLRKMDQSLRENLIKWYFDQDGLTDTSAPFAVSGSTGPTGAIRVPPLREDSGRVSFPELLRAGLLVPGTEVICKALKRQKRSGAKTYIESGKVMADGNVNYNGQHYAIPSKLAIDVVNANGGDTKALNGYKYLYVRVSNRLMPLQELRDRFLKTRTS